MNWTIRSTSEMLRALAMKLFVVLLTVASMLGLAASPLSATTTQSYDSVAFAYDVGVNDGLDAQSIPQSPGDRTARRSGPNLDAAGVFLRADSSSVAPSSRLGGLVGVAVDDPAARALAQRLGGRPSVRFAGDASGREFDVVSDLYVAQSKLANLQLGSSFRNQAKATFETALETNRTPYFHFEGPPQAGVIAKLEEYGARYGIDPVIDVSPLG